MACHNSAMNNTLHSGNNTHGMLKGQCKCSNEFCQSILSSKLLEKQDRRQMVFSVSISAILPNLLLLINGRMCDVQSLIPLLVGLKSSEREHIFFLPFLSQKKSTGDKNLLQICMYVYISWFRKIVKPSIRIAIRQSSDCCQST